MFPNPSFFAKIAIQRNNAADNKNDRQYGNEQPEYERKDGEQYKQNDQQNKPQRDAEHMCPSTKVRSSII